MHRIIFLFLSFVFFGGNAFSQFSKSETAPPNIKWHYKKSKNFTVFFPKELDSIANYSISFLEDNINDIKVYARDDKSISESVVNSSERLNEILDSGFAESKDFRVEYDNTNPLNIRLIYNKRAGFRHQLYIYTKIRS